MSETENVLNSLIPNNTLHLNQRRFSYICIIIFFSSITVLKIGPVEVSYLIAIFSLIVFILKYRWKITYPKKLTKQIQYFYVLIGIVTLSSTLNFFIQKFYVPTSVHSILRKPGFISFSEIAEILIDFGVFIIILSTARNNQNKIKTYIMSYVYGACFTSIFGIISYILLRFFHVNIGGVYGDSLIGQATRLRGGFNEGGPFGLFDSGGLLLLILVRNKIRIKTIKFYIIAITLFLALILSSSKAGIFLIIFSILVAYISVNPRIFIKGLKYSALFVVLATIVLSYTKLGGQLYGYYQTYIAIQESPLLYKNDTSASVGRVAGFIIVPKMIYHNPLLGVGIGNYSLTRNDKQYLGPLPTENIWDLPGLGLYGDIATVGIPGGILIALFFLYPYFLVRKINSPVNIVILSLIPFSSLLFGVQVTFLYPWVVEALVALLVINELVPLDG